MSFFKRMLSSVGIGAATVDTVLHGERFTPGEQMEATVNITGGNIEQAIDAIYFSVHNTYEAEYESDGETKTTTKTATLARHKVTEPFVIHPDEAKALPVSLRLPLDAPLTLGKTKVWVQTGLDIKRAIDPGDKDYIKVAPNALMQTMFDAMQQLGFALFQAECEAAGSLSRNGRPFIQEFEFKPTAGPYRGQLDELEVVCFPKADRLDLLLEIDRKARGFSGWLSEALDLDERRLMLSITAAETSELTAQLQTAIDDWI